MQAMLIAIMVSSISTYLMPSRLAIMKNKATLLLAVIRRRLRILYQHLLPVGEKMSHYTPPTGWENQMDKNDIL
jgi:hypothetical protein